MTFIRHHATEGRVLEDERDQLERICAMIERIAQRLNEVTTDSTHSDHRREAKE
ncbi:MAG: hypothetical protein ACQEXI_16200 [Pseudomonadota bacterium]